MISRDDVAPWPPPTTVVLRLAVALLGASDGCETARALRAEARATRAESRLLRSESSSTSAAARQVRARRRPLREPPPEVARAPCLLDMHVLRDGRHDVVLLRGELDLASRDRLASLLDSLHAPGVTVDLTGLSFIDATGLEVLLRARRDGATHGRSVGLRGARGLVRRVFSLLELESLLEGEEVAGR